MTAVSLNILDSKVFNMSETNGIGRPGGGGMSMPKNGGTRGFFNVVNGIPVGVWFAIVGKRVVAKGENAKEVYRKARAAFPGEEIFIARLPRNQVMLL
jgi:hypothetical protein